MKLKVKPWRLIWRFLLTLLVIYLFIFLFSFQMFVDVAGHLVPWNYRHYLLVFGVLGASIISFIPSLFNYYYTLESDCFTLRKYSKIYEFKYSNIEYLDEENSLKKGKIIFYSKGSKMHSLLSDKNNLVIREIKKRAKHLKSKEQFLLEHPEER